MLLLIRMSTAGNHPDLEMRGRMAYRHGHIREAERFYAMLANLEPRDITHRWNLGRCYVRLEKKQMALDVFSVLQQEMQGFNETERQRYRKEIFHTRRWVRRLSSELSFGWIGVAEHGRYLVRDDGKPFFPVFFDTLLASTDLPSGCTPVGRLRIDLDRFAVLSEPARASRVQMLSGQCRRWGDAGGRILLALDVLETFQRNRSVAMQSLQEVIRRIGDQATILAWHVDVPARCDEATLSALLLHVRKLEYDRNRYGKYHLLSVAFQEAPGRTFFFSDPLDVGRLQQAAFAAAGEGGHPVLQARTLLGNRQVPVMFRIGETTGLEGLVYGNSGMDFREGGEWILTDVCARIDWRGFASQFWEDGFALEDFEEGRVNILSDGKSLLGLVRGEAGARKRTPWTPALQPQLILHGLQDMEHHYTWYDVTTGEALSHGVCDGGDLRLDIPVRSNNRLLCIPAPTRVVQTKSPAGMTRIHRKPRRRRRDG